MPVKLPKLPSDSQQALVPISEAARILGVSIDTIRRWDRKGILHSERVDGRNRYFSVSELEKVKFDQPLPISEAAKRLGVSATTLRRLEAKDLIKPQRNESGARVYSRQSLEKFLQSEYFLRRQEIQEKILQSLEKEAGSREAGKTEDVTPKERIVGALELENRREITHLVGFRQTFYLAGLFLATLFVLIVIVLTVFFIFFPEDTSRFIGVWHTPNPPTSTAGGSDRPSVLGVSYQPDNQGNILGKALKPFGRISLTIVRQIDGQSYRRALPGRMIEDVNEVLTIDNQGNVMPYYNLKFPDSSYLNIPDSGLVSNLNADFLRGKVPGEGEGDLAVIDQEGFISGLKVISANLSSEAVTAEKIADKSITAAKLGADVSTLTDGSVITAKLADNAVTSAKIKDGEVKEGDLADSAVTSAKISDGTITNSDLSSSAAIADSKLSQLTTANKVAGSAVQLKTGGGLLDSSGLTLLTSCSANQVLAWSGTAWACTDSGGSGDITAVTAGAGLTDGGTSGAVTLNIGAGTGITVNTDDIAVDTAVVTTLTGSQTLTNKTLTAPKFADGGYIADSSGNEILIFDTNSSAVNQLTITNSTIGSGLTFSATGDDAGVDLAVNSKAAGALTLDSGTTGAVNIGNSANAKTITIGNATTSTGLVFTSGTGGISATSTATTGTGLSFSDSVLTSGSLISFTSTNNSAANTAWSADLLTVNNNQGTTAVSTGSIAGLDVQFTQNTSVGGNTETAARVAIKQNDSSSTDQTVSSILSLENNDTSTGNQISITDGLKILAGTANNIINAVNLSGTFLTNLITSSNFSVTNDGAVTAVGVNAGSGAISGTGGLTVSGATVSLNASSNNTTNINTGSSTGTVTIGGTAGNTINIGSDDTTADTITIGSAKDSLALASAKWSLTSAGALTLSPSANSTTPLTVNATTGTAALAAAINQTQAADALDINLTHTSGTAGAGLAITVNGTGGTTTDALKITQSAGTVTNGLTFSGTFTNLINATNFSVSNAGAVTAVGVNAGSGLLQGSGGLTISGGDISLTSASSLVIPNSGGYAPTADASIGYDTTQDKYVSGGGTGANTGSFPRVLSVANSTSDTLSCSTISTTETAFATTYSIPANFFINNKVLRVTAAFETTATAITHRLKMRVQSAGPTNVDIWDTGAATSAAQTNRTRMFTWTIGGTAAPGSSVSVMTAGLLNSRDPNMLVNDTLNQPVSINTSAAQTLQFTLTCGSATAGNTYSLMQLIVEELN